MLTKLYRLTDEHLKSFLIRNDHLHITGAYYRTESEFLEKMDKKSVFIRQETIAIKDIVSISHNEMVKKQMVFRLPGRKLFVHFQHNRDLLEVADYIKHQRSFTTEIRSVSKWKAIIPSSVCLIIVAAFAYGVYDTAINLEGGGHANTNGTTGGSQKIFTTLATKIGSQNALIIGTGLISICLFYLYRAIQKPPKEIVYQSSSKMEKAGLN